MKKVRYAFGALGAVPALGLATPPATAATHVSARTGKTVSMTRRTPEANCNARHATGTVNDFSATIYYSRDIGCIGSVRGAFYNHTSRNWWMRVRSYSAHGVYTRYNTSGVVRGNTIYFSSQPFGMRITQVCEAIVNAASPSKVKFGPVCENTGY